MPRQSYTNVLHVCRMHKNIYEYKCAALGKTIAKRRPCPNTTIGGLASGDMARMLVSLALPRFCVMKTRYFEHTCADPESFFRGGPTLTMFLSDFNL